MKMSMKMKLFPLMAIICMVLFTSCKKEDDAAFDYDQSLLYGRWRVTAKYVEGEWKSLTTSSAEQYFFPTYATFDSDGSYWGGGEFGNFPTGKYRVDGDEIIVYVAGVNQMTYTIKKLSYMRFEFVVSIAPGEKYQFTRQ